MKNVFVIGLLGCLALVTGCSINHPVAKDYPHYLEGAPDPELPSTDLNAQYTIDEETRIHRYEFRAATVGYAHRWIVEFGKILDLTLQADYVQKAFGELEQNVGASTDTGGLVTFQLDNYEFKNYRAYVALNITLNQNGVEVINKTYTAQGNSQGGKMWIGGPFAMKNGTLQSTKSAIDTILRQFITDTERLGTS